MSEYQEDELQFPDFNEHAQNRGMWAGSQVNKEHITWIKQGDVFKMETLHYSAAMMKYFDEIIVNCCDQYIRKHNTPLELGGPVTKLEFSFDKSTGIFTATNNGPGIPTYPVEKLGGIYSVEAVIKRPFSGRNFNDDKETDRVTGGINGVGIKVVNSNSTMFEIETVDSTRKIFYRQKCHDGLKKIDPPTVICFKESNAKITAAQKSPHTTVRFRLNYANVCKDQARKKNPEWVNARNMDMVEKLLEFRLYQLSAFIQSISYRYEGETRIDYKKKARVTFNGRVVKVRNLKEFAERFGFMEFTSLEIKGPKFPWNVCFADNVSKISKWATYDAKKLQGKLVANYMSIINGVHVSLDTNHHKPLWDQIIDYVKPKAEKALSMEFGTTAFSNLVKKMIFIFDCRQIPVAQIFNSQSKDSMSLGKKQINEWKRDYIIPKRILNEIWNMMLPKLEHLYLSKAKRKQTRKKFIRKYEPARKAGSKKYSQECSLFIPEGDSAAKTMRDIISNKKHGLGWQYYGMYNIQGVPPNALKETTLKKLKNGSMVIQKSAKMRDNVAFQGLVDAVNLNYNHTYYFGSSDLGKLSKIDRERRRQGDKEFAELHYRCLIVAVDQDLDGIGQIFSLIMVFIARFWPELIKRGFLKRFATPIIRVYGPKHTVEEFYSDGEYQAWKREKFQTDDDSEIPTSYDVHYYKGLATHTPEEVDHMGANFRQNLFTYVWDKDADEQMNIYFGPQPDLRKIALSSPVTTSYNAKLYNQNIIKCSEHFQIEAKAQKLDFVHRKLKSALDGLIPVQRKAVAGARRIFANNKKPKKVYQITGKVTDNMRYQHGDTSMNDTIIKMAQTHTGTCNMPLFIPISNGFGDRTLDRSKTGSPRYIETKLNTRLVDLLFPREDDYLLPHVFDEGVQCEPKYYVPIIPYSILESITTPSAGWSITCSARELQYVLDNVRAMIEYGYPAPAGTPLPLNKKVWTKPKMHIEYMVYSKSNRGRADKVGEVCIGEYQYDAKQNRITVTQLPPQIWTHPYKCKLMGRDPDNGKDTNRSGKPLPSKEFVKNVWDETGNDEVKLIVELVPGGYEAIMENYGDEFLDPIEDYLGLAKPLHSNINMTLSNGAVRSFENYEQVMEYWFSTRKQLYTDRINRHILLWKFKIIYYENIIRFIEMDANETINIDRKAEDVRIKILEDNEFRKIHKTNLFTPKYIPTDELESRIFNPPLASYGYIDSITVGMKSEKSYQSLMTKLQEARDELEKLLASTYKDLWLRDLNEIEKVIHEGLASNWLFGSKQHIFKKAVVRNAKKVAAAK